MKKNKSKLPVEEADKSQPSFDLDLDELRVQLLGADDFVMEVIDTIPPKMYFSQDVQEQMTAEKHAVMDDAAKGMKRSHPGVHELKSKGKHKRARLDPSQHKSVSQIQREMESDKKPKMKKGVPSSASLERAANIEELQERLQQRIQGLQAKRRGCSEEEFLKRKRLRNKAKKMRKKQKGNTVKPALHNTPQAPLSKKLPKDFKPKPIYNKDGKIIYSKFDFAESGDQEKKTGKQGGKNYKKLIEQVEKGKEKIENLRLKGDNEKAESIAQKNAWQRAIQKAEGVKVKDDLGLLKKAAKKQEKQKSKSGKEWQKRQVDVERKKKAKQDKRKKNIQAKKQEKLGKKIKKAKKKGRIIPGF